MKRPRTGTYNALSPGKAVSETGAPAKRLLKPERAALFSGAMPHPHKNLGKYLHSKKSK